MFAPAIRCVNFRASASSDWLHILAREQRRHENVSQQKLRSWRGGPRPQNKERGFESSECESRVVRAMQEKAKNHERGIGYEPIVGQTRRTAGIGSTEATKDTLVSTPSTAPRRALTETMPGSSDDAAVVLLGPSQSVASPYIVPSWYILSVVERRKQSRSPSTPGFLPQT